MVRPKHCTSVSGVRKRDFDRLVCVVQKMVDESGNPVGFDAASWVARWLDGPIPALGNKTPASYMRSAAGRKVVMNLLRQAQSGAYA